MPDALSTLIGRMTPACRGALARAANLCVAHGHHEVDVEHTLLAMLDTRGCDLDLILERLGNVARLVRVDLESRLRVFRDGNALTPVFAGFIPSLLEQADAVAGEDVPGRPIRTGHVLLALLERDEWRPMLARVSPQLAALDVGMAREALRLLGTDAIECPRDVETADASLKAGSSAISSQSDVPGALERFTIDLTERARAGRVDPVVGRELETLQLINILCRRRQNNPILVGEAGVGKTAVVEGLALAIARGSVPDLLKDTHIRSLDMGLLQAGASVKGEFESRLRGLLEDIQASPQPVILFIDEAHTLIGAGGTAGQNDAANLLKPALARGELRTIAATTWAEYKRYVEKDAALARRFQPVKVAEPDHATAEDMLRAIVPTLEAHSGVRVTDEAVRAAVALSARYIADRQLPDKAIALLDTAVAKVMLSRCEPHPDVSVAEARFARAEARFEALRRDSDDVLVPTDLIKTAEDHRGLIGRHLNAVREALASEHDLRDQGHTSGRTENSMLPRLVDADIVATVVADWTGIPVGRLDQSGAAVLAHLETRMAERVVGQDHVLNQVASRVRVARAHLGDPGRPQGVFLFVGPSGVGKTETALALAEALNGDERQLITVNMSEYQEPHSISGLKGAPAGYVGYGEGGALTEAIRRRPYSVLLLDEVEKAHPDVMELFYQVFDRGYMADAEGREVDFRQTIIILTGNVGSAAVMQACINQPDEARPDPDALLDLLRPALYKAFKPAFLGRTTVVPYYPLTDDALEAVIRRRLGLVAARLKERHDAELAYDNAVIEWVLCRCKEADAGARDAIRVIDCDVVGALANMIMAGAMTEGDRASIKLAIETDGRLTCERTSAAVAVAEVEHG